MVETSAGVSVTTVFKCQRNGVRLVIDVFQLGRTKRGLHRCPNVHVHVAVSFDRALVTTIASHRWRVFGVVIYPQRDVLNVQDLHTVDRNETSVDI